MSLKREESPIIMQSNIKPNMFLKYSRTYTLNMTHKRKLRKELSMISIWNMFHKKEFRKESNIRQLKNKLITNLNKRSNKSNTLTSYLILLIKASLIRIITSCLIRLTSSC